MIPVYKWSLNGLKLLHFSQALCGLPINTYFSAVKLRWLLDNCEAVKKAVEEDRCLFGTVDSWLIWVWNVYYIFPCFEVVTLINHVVCLNLWTEYIIWGYLCNKPVGLLGNHLSDFTGQQNFACHTTPHRLSFDIFKF